MGYAGANDTCHGAGHRRKLPRNLPLANTYVTSYHLPILVKRTSLQTRLYLCRTALALGPYPVPRQQRRRRRSRRAGGIASARRRQRH